MTEISTEKKSVTPQQRKAIECLLTTGSITEAASAANVNRSTVYKWRKKPEFVDALKEAEAEAVEGLSRQLAGMAEQAAGAFRDALHGGQDIKVRLRAAESLTDRLLRLRELITLEQRVAALEAAGEVESE